MSKNSKPNNKFEMPNFEVPKMEVPAAFREFAEKSVSQAKDNWEMMKAVTEDATDMIETPKKREMRSMSLSPGRYIPVSQREIVLAATFK